MPDNELTVKIPKAYLMTLAVYGNMGDGKIPEFMKVWAEMECNRLGLTQELKELKAKRLIELAASVRNVIGDKMFGELVNNINTVADAIKSSGVMKDKPGGV